MAQNSLVMARETRHDAGKRLANCSVYLHRVGLGLRCNLGSGSGFDLELLGVLLEFATQPAVAQLGLVERAALAVWLEGVLVRRELPR